MSEDIHLVDNESHINSNATSSTPLKKKRRLRSKVWLDFERDDTNEIAICRHCKKTFKSTNRLGTSHLRNHLEICIKNPGRTSIVVQGNDERKQSFNQERSRTDLARMIILHEYPFSIVDHVGFRIYSKNLQPDFNMVSRDTIKSDCVGLFANEKKKLYNYLDNMSSRISLTSDVWTSNQNKGYMCLTAHFIDEYWKLQKRILNFFMVESPHTGLSMARVILQKLYEWNIDKKLTSLVLDNSSANDVMAREIVSRLGYKLLLNGVMFHVHCCTHIINLIVQDGVKEISLVIEKVRASVKFVKSSIAREQLFGEVVHQVRSPHKSVSLDVPTRWNSTYIMLNTVLELKDAFVRYAERDEAYKEENLLLSVEEWENAHLVCQFLKNFYEVIVTFSGVKTPTANLYFIEICKIYVLLEKCSSSSVPFMVSMASVMMKKFKKYWDTVSTILAIAVVLDPKLKFQPVNFFFELIYGEAAEEKIQDIHKGLRDLYNEYRSIASEFSSVEFYDNVEAADGNSGQPSIFNTIEVTQKFRTFCKERSLNLSLKLDLDIYLEEEAIYQSSGQESFEILTWWKENASRYPIMARMARDILAIPVSTVASESAFSTGGRVLDDYRSSMTPTTVEALLCAQDWIRNNMQDCCDVVDDISSLSLIVSNLNENQEDSNT